MNRRIFTGIVIVALVVVAGIIALRSRPVEQPSTRLAPPRAGDLRLAPDIAIILYQGQQVLGTDELALSTLWERQQKPVVLNFWAGLCPPCRAEMPDLQRLYDTHAKDKWVLIGLDIGPFIGLGSRDDAKTLLRELKVSYPAGTTFDARTVRNYEILGMPTTVSITVDGKILRKHAGLLTLDQMIEFTDEVIRESAMR